MKTDFKFNNLLGTVYSQGNLLFSPDGTLLYSPVGNRVTVFNLVDNKCHTLPLTHRSNISRLALTPSGDRLLSIDDSGQLILTDVRSRVKLYYLSLNAKPGALAVSPSGEYFAVGLGRRIDVWKLPDTSGEGDREIAPFVRHRIHKQHFDDVRHIEWSSDSRFFLTASKDLTARIWSVDREEGFKPTVLSGHKQGVVGAWFSKDQETIYTVSKDGALFTWQYVRHPDAPPPADDDDSDVEMAVEKAAEEDTRWRITERHYFMQNANCKCAVFHPETNLVVAGFSNGIFALYELPDFSLIHTLSISQSDVDCVAINGSGEWLAFGSSRHGQLLVWEWQSESYILKQQGHFDSMNALAYSPDGKRIVTTADDGKIKVWDTESGFCIVTFTEHTSGVTACEFAKKGNVLFTASLDGSIRAWDLVRYRNFRTFTAPTRLSFSCLAVDPTGEVVAAGSLDSFDVHIWSVQTGQLLDRLAGHEGPVSALAFAPNGGTLVSGSWDKTARLWNIFSRTQTSEPILLEADVLDVAFRPDSLQMAVSTLNGQLTFWSVADAEQVGGLDGRRDVSGGRKVTDRQAAANVANTKHFNSIRYSTDGTCLLAAGNSKYICLYSVAELLLVRKFTVSVNTAIQGTQQFLDSRRLTEAGHIDTLDTAGDASDLEDRIDRTLPGSKRGGDPSARQKNPEMRVSGVAFSPAGSAFCAASTEGLLIYSLDGDARQFDPFDLSVAVTPAAILHALDAERDYLKALAMAFRLNEPALVTRVFYTVPHAAIPAVAEDLPTPYVARLLRFVAKQAEESPHLLFCLAWLKAVTDRHGPWLAANRAKVDVELRLVARAVARQRDEIKRLAEGDAYTLEYLLSQRKGAGKGGAVNGTTAVKEVELLGESLDEEMPDDDDEGWVGLD